MGLQVSDLSFSYGAKTALEDVSFTVESGRFAALLGPNGAGKSTLFSLLTRLFVTQGGAISVAGHDLATAPLTAMADLGVVFQQTTLDLDLSVRQNLRYFAALHAISGRDADRRIDGALARLGPCGPNFGSFFARVLSGSIFGPWPIWALLLLMLVYFYGYCLTFRVIFYYSYASHHGDFF